MDRRGEGKDTLHLPAVANRGQTSKVPAGIMGTRKPQNLGKPLILPLFILFEAHEKCFDWPPFMRQITTVSFRLFW